MYTVFGCRDCNQAKITLAGNVVRQVSSCKYLGVYIDQDMKWTEHIDYIYSKLIKSIGIFLQVKKQNSTCMSQKYLLSHYMGVLLQVQ